MVACLAESAGGFWRNHPPATEPPSRVVITLYDENYGVLPFIYCADSYRGEGVSVSGGWNGCVFGGKCWWVLAKSPSGDELTIQ